MNRSTPASNRLTPWPRVSLLVLVLLMGGGGAAHFLIPDSYVALIPGSLGNAHVWIYGSGVAEIACGVLLLLPRTRRLGAWMTIVVLVLVFPGNVKMALDGGIADAPFPASSAAASWIRLPFQALFIWWAWIFTRRERDVADDLEESEG